MHNSLKEEWDQWRLCWFNHFGRLITLQEKSSIGWRLHRRDHFLNHWLKRMWDNMVKRHITLQNRTGIIWIWDRHDHFINQLLIILLGNQRRHRNIWAFRQGPCSLYHGNSKAQMSKVIFFSKLTRELGLTSYFSRLLNIIDVLNMTCSGRWVSPYMTCSG